MDNRLFVAWFLFQCALVFCANAQVSVIYFANEESDGFRRFARSASTYDLQISTIEVRKWNLVSKHS